MNTQPSQPHRVPLVQLKLEAFERLQPEFETCFQFIQDVHGQKRFPSFRVADIVYYLHARWICESKGLLLSVPNTTKKYEGRRCLELLNVWQQDDTADVVDFLQLKLDMLPLAQITQHYQEARQHDDSQAQRLIHGRQIMLNRGFNLMQALDAIFTLPVNTLLTEVRAACKHYGHLPEQITQQLEEMNSPIYSYMPNQALAQRNMTLMNKLGVNGPFFPSDLPAHRSWHIVTQIEPLSPYAEHVVAGYQELLSPIHNNIKAHRFVDHPS